MRCLVLLILIGSQDPNERLEVNHIAGAKIPQVAGKETEELATGSRRLGRVPPKTGTVEAAWTCGLQR